jgi:AcrR family transcriptional regulator
MPARGKGAPGAAPKAARSADRPTLPREFIAVHKRRRIMDALAELTAKQGYEATKVSDIVRHAAVARKTLYDNFTGKEQVFLAAFDAAVEEMTSRIEEACADAEADLQEKVEAGLEAFLDYIAEDPALARMCLIEALSATPATTERYEDALQGFVDLARRALPQDDRLPETIEETLVGGVVWIAYQQIRRGETEHVTDLLPELSEFVMAPYVGIGIAEGADTAV